MRTRLILTAILLAITSTSFADVTARPLTTTAMKIINKEQTMCKLLFEFTGYKAATSESCIVTTANFKNMSARVAAGVEDTPEFRKQIRIFVAINDELQEYVKEYINQLEERK